MPEAAPEQQGPSVQELLGQLGGQISELTRAQQMQAQTIQQLAQGTQAVAQRVSQPPPQQQTPSEYQAANEKYLQALALDPIALRRTEMAQIRQDMQAEFRNQMQQTLGAMEMGRQAEELQRQVFAANPDVAQDAPTFNHYLTLINQDQRWNGYSYVDRINAAIQSTREHRAQREKDWAMQQGLANREIQRASFPGAGSFSDPGRADDGSQPLSEYDAHRRRFDMMKDRQSKAMGGGRYGKK